MPKPGLFRGDLGFSIVLGIVAFLGAAHVLIRTAVYGIGQYGDAGVYMEYAESLAAGDGFLRELRFEKDVLIWWPPLFPMVLAFFRLSGVELAEAGRYLNAISLGLIILIAGHWLYRHVRSRLVVLAASITIVISYPLPRISSHVMSETLFILVTLLALVQIESFLSGRTANTGFLLSLVFSALAPLIRWMGFAVIFTGILLILMHQGTPTRVRWKRAVLYGAASSLPLALWLTRSWIVSGVTLVGLRENPGSRQSHWDALSQFGDILYTYSFVGQESGWLGICLWAVAALIALEATTLLTSRRATLVTRREIRRSDNSTVQPAFPFAVFAIVYSITLIVATPFWIRIGIIDRYVSPIYVPAVMAAAVWLDRFLLSVCQSSGFSVWKSMDSWGIRYDKSSGPMAMVKWLLIGLILTFFLANSVRNIVSHVDIFITDNPLEYIGLI